MVDSELGVNESCASWAKGCDGGDVHGAVWVRGIEWSGEFGAKDFA